MRTGEAFGAQTRKPADVLLASKVAPSAVVALGASRMVYMRYLRLAGHRGPPGSGYLATQSGSSGSVPPASCSINQMYVVRWCMQAIVWLILPKGGLGLNLGIQVS